MFRRNTTASLHCDSRRLFWQPALRVDGIIPNNRSRPIIPNYPSLPGENLRIWQGRQTLNFGRRAARLSQMVARVPKESRKKMASSPFPACGSTFLNVGFLARREIPLRVTPGTPPNPQGHLADKLKHVVKQYDASRSARAPYPPKYRIASGVPKDDRRKLPNKGRNKGRPRIHL